MSHNYLTDTVLSWSYIFNHRKLYPRNGSKLKVAKSVFSIVLTSSWSESVHFPQPKWDYHFSTAKKKLLAVEGFRSRHSQKFFLAVEVFWSRHSQKFFLAVEIFKGWHSQIFFRLWRFSKATNWTLSWPLLVVTLTLIGSYPNPNGKLP